MREEFGEKTRTGKFIGYFQMSAEFRKSSVERQRMGIVMFLKSDVDKL